MWVNVLRDTIPEASQSNVACAVSDWRSQAQADDNTSTLRMVHRRLVATSQDDDATTGMLPLHLGHLQDFDGGHVPRPIVDDLNYFVVVEAFRSC